MLKLKDIRLKPIIGNWYEYKPSRKYNSEFIFGALENQNINDLLDLHYRWGNQIVESLKQNLDLATELHEVVVAQQKYSEFLSAHASNVVSCIVDSGLGEFNILVDYRLALGIINRATGGKGEARKSNDPLTDIEQIILHTVLAELVGSYAKQWQNIFQAPVHLDYVSPKLKIDEKIKKDAEVMSFNIQVALGEDVASGIEVMFSNSTLEAMFEAYQKTLQAKPKKITVYLSPESVNNVKVPVDVVVGHTAVSMTELLNLEPGDVFQLNESLSDTVHLSINNEADFYGLLGKREQNFAVKIVDRKAKYVDLQMTESIQEKAVQADTIEADLVDTDLDSTAETESNVVQDFTPAKVEEIEVKDELLEQFAPEPQQAAAKDEEFTWDLDDLK